MTDRVSIAALPAVGLILVGGVLGVQVAYGGGSFEPLQPAVDHVLDQIGAVRVPRGVAVPSKIHRDHVVVRGEANREVIEAVRVSTDAVQHDQRRLARRSQSR